MQRYPYRNHILRQKPVMKPYIYVLSVLILAISCSPTVEDIKEPKSSMGTLPAEDHFWQRNYPEETFDYKVYMQSMSDEAQKVRSRSIQGNWVDQGPGNLGGRVNCMVIHPDNDQIIYLGYSRGGVYKTVDGGANWESIFNEFTYLSISHIELDPNNANNVYIGTGDENISGYPEIGNGIYKSDDAGLTWTNMGLNDESIIGRIHIAPSDSDVIYASAMGIPFEKNNDRGVYKSLDGGNQWEQVLFINDSTGVIDMVVDPTNPDIVYAAGWNRLRSNYASKISGPDARIWKTIDGGANWNMLDNGLPTGDLTRIGLNMWDGDSNVLYASYSASREVPGCSGSGNQLIGIYKTTDGGASWSPIPTDEATNGLPCNLQGGFAWYFGQIRVNPNNVDDISIIGVRHYRTLDGGTTWVNMVPLGDVHVDYHELIYRDDIMYVGNDGGAYKSNLDGEWTDIENISTNQFYRVAYNPHQPDTYYGGLQDNGSTGGSGLDINNWERIWGGDGFQMAFHPTDPNMYFAESQNGNIVQFDNGIIDNYTDGLNGDKNWDMPYFISDIEDDVMYTGTDAVYKRHIYNDQEWIAISGNITDQDDDSPYIRHNVSTIHQSNINADYVYVGTSDGVVHRQESSGAWTNITEGLIRRYVTDIKASPSNEETVYVTLSGYKNNDNTPLVYRSDDRGDNWVSIMGDLPPIAVNDIYILDGYNDQVIFIGNEAGIYLTQDAGVSWERLGDNMPFVPTYDLEYNPVTNLIIAGTFGRGLQTFDLNQIDLNVDVATYDPQLDAVSVYPTVVESLINIDNPAGIEFSLNIYDASGKLINTYQNTQPSYSLDHLTSGIFYLQIKKADAIKIEKIIKI